MEKLMSELQNIMSNYHLTMRNASSTYWKKFHDNKTHNENAFYELFCIPSETFKDFHAKRGLNPSSFSGIILEWALFYFLDEGLLEHSKTDVSCVANRHQIDFPWKKKGPKKVNLDLVIKNKKTKKIYYAFEVKTTFEKGFEKYLAEKKEICHHRSKVFPNFKYYYLSIDAPQPATKNKHKRDLKTLCKRKELYIINKSSTGYPGVKEFLELISDAIQKIE